jgi:23S rRNA pseudouridine1911/1915/1917 synthase
LDQPYILDETGDFAVVYKPPKMHCAPLKHKVNDTLVKWYITNSSVHNAELIHRLDFETHGLVLFAKNNKSFNFFKELQDNGNFIKEYSAVCLKTIYDNPIPGFPPPPDLEILSGEKPLFIESYFRPFGQGRKQVRPVLEISNKKYFEIATDKGYFYRTEITGINGNFFTIRLKRGFRHQIRCHLCWIGFPILNDPLYNPQPTEYSIQDTLALRAHALYFTDPSNGKQREYRIPGLVLNEKINCLTLGVKE